MREMTVSSSPEEVDSVNRFDTVSGHSRHIDRVAYHGMMHSLTNRFAALLAALLALGLTVGAPARAADDTFGCLTALGGPLVRFNGDVGYKQIQRSGVANETRFDARGLTIRQQTQPSVIGDEYPIDIRLGSRSATACWAGGLILNTNSPSISWRSSKHPNNAALIFKEGQVIVDGVRIHNAHDGIRPWHRSSDGAGLSGFNVWNSWFSYIRDDCIENDSGIGGVIEDNLFDGCYVFLSARGAEAQGTQDAKLITISQNLIHLQKMPGPFGHDLENLDGHGELFKFDAGSPRIALHNNIFLIEGLPITRYGPESWRKNAPVMLSLRPELLASCAGNTIVWLGDGPFPGKVPADPGCVTITTDISVWETARAAWLAAHPSVARVPGIDP